MCCITRYVIKHFYGEGRKCCGPILHCAHSAAHFHASVCLWVCVWGRGAVEPSVGIGDCLCVHLGPGLLCVNYTSSRVCLYL